MGLEFKSGVIWSGALLNHGVECTVVTEWLLPNSISKDLPVGLGWFLMFWIALVVLVNSLYWTLVPILVVGECKSFALGLGVARLLSRSRFSHVGFRFVSSLV